jgi:hypothetical protein
MSFQQALAFGRIGENYIVRYLLRKGWSLLPVYEIETEESNKGPRLTLPDDSELVAPDCLMFRQGRVCWVETKRKSNFTWHRNSAEWTTGIDVEYYEHYLEIRRRFGFDLWLLFLHLDPQPSAADLRYQCPAECPTGLFGGEISALKELEHHRHQNWGKRGMVYWADSVLMRLATTEEVLSAIQRKPPTSESLEIRAEGAANG